MADLFTSDVDAGPLTPLAERLRPKTIDEVIGQRHLLAPGKPLGVPVTVERQGDNSPIELTVVGLPDGLAAAPAESAEGKTARTTCSWPTLGGAGAVIGQNRPVPQWREE